MNGNELFRVISCYYSYGACERATPQRGHSTIKMYHRPIISTLYSCMFHSLCFYDTFEFAGDSIFVICHCFCLRRVVDGVTWNAILMAISLRHNALKYICRVAFMAINLIIYLIGLAVDLHQNGNRKYFVATLQLSRNTPTLQIESKRKFA